MDNEPESRCQKRKFRRDSVDLIESQGEVAESRITIPDAHRLQVAAMADDGASVRLRGEFGTIFDDERIEVAARIKPETADTLEEESYDTFSEVSGGKLSESIRSLSEDIASGDSHGSPEHRRRFQVPPPPLPAIQPGSLVRAAETFLSLCDAIARFLAAFAKQELSPFKKFPSKASDKERSLSSSKSTTAIEMRKRFLPTDHHAMMGIVHTTNSGSPLLTGVNQKEPSGDIEWKAQRERIGNMLLRFLQWKGEFGEGDLQAVLDGTSSTGFLGEGAVKSQLLSMGKKLSDLVAFQMDKASLNERVLDAAKSLDDWLQKGKEAQAEVGESDDTSSISSDSTTSSSTELADAADQQLDQLDIEMYNLVRMGIPDLLKKSRPRRTSWQRQNSATLSPFREDRNKTSHTYSRDSLTLAAPATFQSSMPGSTSGPYSFPDPRYTLGNTTALHSEKRRKTEETDPWASTPELLQRLRLYWRDKRPPPDVENWLCWEGFFQPTLVTSCDPTMFQAGKLRAALASFEQSQREPTDSVHPLTTLFSKIQIQPVNNRICTDLVQNFRNAAPKVQHDPILKTPGSLLDSAESVDFTLALLESLPQWILYTNFPNGKQLALSLGASVQTALLDEFWDSCADMAQQALELFPFGDSDTDSELAKHRYVQNLLLQRIKRLRSLQINRALMPAWIALVPMVDGLASRLRDLSPDMPKFDTETGRQFVAPPVPPAAPRPQTVAPIPLSPKWRAQPHSTPQFGYGSTGGLFREVRTIDVPDPILLPPAHLLFYGTPASGDGLGWPTSPPQHGSTTSTYSMGEEATGLGTSMCTIWIGEEFCTLD
ncbi:hypothetical protein F5Y14DRAFT_417059 [Nemania sp. NC0429]|nr:hypothetical protein F5Y14DRAFT_417059 [Nemania sp. NC0429]